MTRIAIYPGTFDPITNGHIDLVQPAAQVAQMAQHSAVALLEQHSAVAPAPHSKLKAPSHWTI